MENLRELGIDVTVVQRPRQLLNPLDADMAAFLHAQLRQKGVKLMLEKMEKEEPQKAEPEQEQA